MALKRKGRYTIDVTLPPNLPGRCAISRRVVVIANNDIHAKQVAIEKCGWKKRGAGTEIITKETYTEAIFPPPPNTGRYSVQQQFGFVQPKKKKKKKEPKGYMYYGHNV